MKPNLQAVLDAMDGITYVVSRDGRILQYGVPNWNRFAIENGAPELADGNQVVGRPLIDFISGDDVKDAYERYMAELRTDDPAAILLPCRCDAPAVRRETRLAMSPVRTGDFEGILCQSIVTDEMIRPPLNIFDFKVLQQCSAVKKNVPIVAMCSTCQKTRLTMEDETTEDVWVEADDYYRCGGTSDVQISHTFCPTCYQGHVDRIAHRKDPRRLAS